jgi:hypothetical protein
MGGVSKIDADSNSHSLYLESFDKLVKDPNCFLKCRAVSFGIISPAVGYLSKASTENGAVIYQTGRNSCRYGFHCKALYAINSSGPKFSGFGGEEFAYYNVGFSLNISIHKNRIDISYFLGFIGPDYYFEDHINMDNSFLVDEKTWKFIYFELDTTHIIIYLNNSQYFSYSFRRHLDVLNGGKIVGYGFYFSNIEIRGKCVDNLYYDKTGTLRTSAVVSVLDVIDYQRFASYDEEYDKLSKEQYIQLLRRKAIDNKTALPLKGISDIIFEFEKIEDEVPIYGYQLTFIGSIGDSTRPKKYLETWCSDSFREKEWKWNFFLGKEMPCQYFYGIRKNLKVNEINSYQFRISIRTETDSLKSCAADLTHWPKLYIHALYLEVLHAPIRGNVEIAEVGKPTAKIYEE